MPGAETRPTQTQPAQILVAELRAALPDGALVTEAAEVARRSTDATGTAPAGTALALALPQETAHVQAVLRIATAHRTPVTVIGAGTGLAGAVSAVDGGIVLSTERMTRVLEVNLTDQVVITQPGVLTADLSARVAQEGAWYAPDPASWRISTIGGNIATNAGGLHCVKYGVTGQSVLALEVVLADGSVIRTGHRSLKGVAGLDLTSLFVGSEGTLGVVTEATLRLRPRPAQVATTVVWTRTPEGAGEVVQAITRTDVQPATLELLDQGSLRNMDAHRGTDLARRGDSLLIVQVDGDDAEGQRSRLTTALAALPVTAEPVDPVTAEWYLEQRRLPRPTPPGQTAVKEDVAVPVSRLVEFLAACRTLADHHGVRFECLAHAGDGNVHAKLLADLEDGCVPQSLHDAADALVRTALDLGGTITGEHGVGRLKTPWLGLELGARQLDLQRRLKAVFDPDGLLSPASFLAPGNQP